MIKAAMVINNHGKARLLKFYEKLSMEKQQQAVRELFGMLAKRSDRVCNFLEIDEGIWGPDTRIVYRHYATLYIVFVVDGSESELGILDLIQVFVESLDRSFQNVCELHLIFHSDQAHHILDEIIMGGMVLETNVKDIAAAVAGMEKHIQATENLSLSSSNSVQMGRRS